MAEINLNTQVQYLKGVGPQLAHVFSKRGVSTVGELLNWFPRAYEDYRAVNQIAFLAPDQIVSFLASVIHVRSFQLGRSRRRMHEVVVGDSSGRISCKYFRIPFRGYFERLEPNTQVRVTGKVTFYRGRKEMHHPDIYLAEGKSEAPKDALLPVYTETEGLRPVKLRKIIDTAIEGVSSSGFPETLPPWILKKFNLLGRREAYQQIHKPPTDKAGHFLKFSSEAQKRIIFEEFFWLELILAKRKSNSQKNQSIPLTKNSEKLEKFLKALPYKLTEDQKKSLKEILEDLKKNQPMQRLLQGDVGSGKTVVALAAAVYVQENAYQSCLMVPTEILAEQHYKNAKKMLEPLGISVALLTGQTKPKKKEAIYKALRAGKVDVCIGTHALLQEGVEFQCLGLIIIDEQHRFGVEQRKVLTQKGIFPHCLVMTATPIPRTLAITVYGDLDVSIIKEKPKGRQSIVTAIRFPKSRSKVLDFLRDQIKGGRQAYVVYPLVEESEKLDLKNAIEEHKKLEEYFASLDPEITLSLLHGQMKAEEKVQVMKAFVDGEVDILVTTTVVEVGVDVPNANIMIVEHAERFGLSQLHQLRGRVGRGAYKSYCILLPGYATSPESLERLKAMTRYEDGFKIAEVDLEIRGPGEFLGRRQSGLPGFRLANLVRDFDILQEARTAAFELTKKDPELKAPEHQALQKPWKEMSSMLS